ncbi:MAG: hypothetical protein ACHQHO_07400 [Solirubrobacterales bacterium]
MTSGSADQTPSEPGPQTPEPTSHEHAAAASQGGASRPQPQQREDFGPLELLRTQKTDGRALLLFSHRLEQAER